MHGGLRCRNLPDVDLHRDAFACLHRLGRVADQVEQDLMQLDGIAAHETAGSLRRDRELHLVGQQDP